MKCPKCLRPVDDEAESCYSCGFSEVEAAAKYGANQVFLNRVHDAAACLRKQERDELGEVLDQMEVNFPQLLFCAYLGVLPDDVSVSELGFWLLNHGQVRGAEYARPNENAILVIIDIETKCVGVSMGYCAERLVSEDEVYRSLVKARPNLLNAEYGMALGTVFTVLAKVLRRKARKLQKSISREPELPASEELAENLLDLPPHLTAVLPQDPVEVEELKTA